MFQCYSRLHVCLAQDDVQNLQEKVPLYMFGKRIVIVAQVLDYWPTFIIDPAYLYYHPSRLSAFIRKYLIKRMLEVECRSQIGKLFSLSADSWGWSAVACWQALAVGHLLVQYKNIRKQAIHVLCMLTFGEANRKWRWQWCVLNSVVTQCVEVTLKFSQ